MEYHTQTVEETLSLLSTSQIGLSESKAHERLKVYGYNELKAKRKTNFFLIFLSQFTDVMVIILILACGVSFLLGIVQHSEDEIIDGAVILFIVILNAVIGVLQEFKAERSLDALKKMVNPKAKVIRQGVLKEISAKELVPGDIVDLEEGEKVPADIRIIESIGLVVDEAMLTGESKPVTKDIREIAGENLVLADKKNILFMGTIVVRGRGKGVVIATGMETAFGKIANLTTEVEKTLSPLQKELVSVGKFIALNVIVICTIVFLIGLLLHNPPLAMFLLAVSLAVAAVPEGLPATVTIALAMGVQRMAKKNAIVRKLNSVETLGSTTVICSDKTGTLTKNEMTVVKVFVDGKVVLVDGIGYEPTGKFMHMGKQCADDTLELLLLSGLLCNNAEHTPENKIIGDPTEGALVVSAKKYGISHAQAKESHVRIHEIPFDSTRKMMSTVHKFGKEHQLIIKGAPDAILERCSQIIVKGKPKQLTQKMRKDIMAMNEEMAKGALRVLAFAVKKVGGSAEDIRKCGMDDLECGLTFIGLQGMIDPPRSEVYDAVRLCKDAGIRVFVISGDFGVTTKAIAVELGIADEKTPVITGELLRGMNDTELMNVLTGKAVFARVDPEHKMRIVSLLKNMGEIVAVTGDGVNDAPAIKKADIGIAMGITGTDVSKEASDMVLMDDSFATIIHAVKEGRTIYADIKKFLTYIFTSNIGELLTVFIGMIIIALLKFPAGTVIITATQILWVNLGTDVLPALALSVDPPEENIMKRSPRNPKKRIITRQVFFSWLPSGIIIAVGTIAVFLAYSTEPLRAGTAAFCTLVLFQMMNVFNCRSKRESLFSIGFFSNKLLLLAVFFSVFLQVLVVYAPFMQDIFSTVALTVKDWVVILLVSSTILIYGEISKAALRKKTVQKGVQKQTS